MMMMMIQGRRSMMMSSKLLYQGIADKTGVLGLSTRYFSSSFKDDSDHKHDENCKHDHNHSGMFEAIDAFIEEADQQFNREGRRDDVPELMGTSLGLEDVLHANKLWAKQKHEKDERFFEVLGGKQRPRYLYIGCSDARVDPGQLLGFKIPGQIFVHRNIGNIVCTTDLNLLSVVDFAVNHLKVPHIIVCGHYDCGAVRGSIAAAEAGGLGLVEHWLRNIRDVARIYKAELEAIEDFEQRQRRLVELNVMEQTMNVLKIPAVQRKRAIGIMNGVPVTLPQVHGLIFDPKVGVLHKLGIDLSKEIADNKAIYNLFEVPDWARSK